MRLKVVIATVQMWKLRDSSVLLLKNMETVLVVMIIRRGVPWYSVDGGQGSSSTKQQKFCILHHFHNTEKSDLSYLRLEL